MENKITSSPTCMEDCHFLKFMSHLFQQHISAPQSSRSLLSPHHGDAFIELIFGGGWCILGETALENSLQSNKLVDRKHESTDTLYWLATNNAIITVVTSTQPLRLVLIPPVWFSLFTCISF